MSAPIDWLDEGGLALTVACGLKLCGAQPGEPCINTAHTYGPRETPHSNRVSRAHRPDADPSVTDWRSTGLSTSAQLRAARAETDRVVGVLIKMRAEREATQAELAKTQAALAASQEDLTAALAVLNGFRLAVDEKVQAAHRLYVEVCAERGHLKDNERRWAAEFEHAERERDEARAELASVVKTLELTGRELDKAAQDREDLTVELEKLRPIAAAARAYVKHPALPPSHDPNEAHAWDVELTRLDDALRNAVLKDGGP